MRVSVNEIELTVKRAAFGAGWPWGLAEDIGRGAAWAAANGLPQAVAEALEVIAAGPRPAQARQARSDWRLEGSTGVAGPSAIDLVLSAPAGAVGVSLARVDAPALLVGLAGLAALGHAACIEIADDGGKVVRVDATSLAAPQGLFSAGADVTIRAVGEAAGGRRAGPMAAMVTNLPAEGLEVDDAVWRQALEMAARSYVPATEESRLRGAGAGLTDND